MKKLSDRQLFYLMIALCGAALGAYTEVARLCRLEARCPDPARAIRRRRMAYLAHGLDWTINVIVMVAGIGRLFKAEDFGGQYQPRWLKVYFMVTGPLPTLAMVATMLSGSGGRKSMQQRPLQRRFHRIAAYSGYILWWISCLPIFIQPFLNRQRALQRQADVAATVETAG